MIKVMIVDDHSILRSGLKMLLKAEEDIEVIAEANSGEEALALLEEDKPDIILLDLAMPGIGGIETLKACRERYEDIYVLVLTMYSDDKYLPKVLELGARGYVVKKSADTVVINAIRIVAKGERFVDVSMIENMINPGSSYDDKVERNLASVDNKETLTPREIEVLKYIAMGYSNKQIAESLFVSIKTVESHKSKIKEKLNMKKRSDLVRYAIQLGLITT